MSKRSLSALMYVLSTIALAIAVYQFIGERYADGALSVLFTLAFLTGAIRYQRAG
jgi:hypothetical protein